MIPAAGSGLRMGGRKKAFLSLEGEPILLHSLRPFLRHPRVAAIAVALPEEEAASPPRWLAELDSRLRLVPGGATRLASVHAALRALPEGIQVVLVHDAARPLVTSQIIDRCIAGAERGEGAVAGWPAVDTLKEVDADRRVIGTPERARFWQAQTPQAFPMGALLAAYLEASAAGAEATDDAQLFERAGGTVRMVEGSAHNLKVTHPDDLSLAGFLLRGGGAGGDPEETR